MICLSCNSEIDEDSKFCIECGAECKNWDCQSCQHTNKYNHKFCIECGAKKSEVDDRSDLVLDLSSQKESTEELEPCDRIANNTQDQGEEPSWWRFVGLGFCILVVASFFMKKDNSPDEADIAIHQASLICQSVDSTGLGSRPCEYSGWDSSITVTLDTSGSEARSICRGIVNESNGLNFSWDGRWKIKVNSVAGHQLAYCTL